MLNSTARRLSSPRRTDGNWWLRMAGRALLVILVLLGARELLFGTIAMLVRPHAVPARTITATAFPAEGARAFAARFSVAYLTFDSQHPETRASALATYMSNTDDPSAGWDGAGHQAALQALPVGMAVADNHHAAVTVEVLTDTGRWLFLSVPVSADGGGNYAVSAAPCLVPPPGKASVAPIRDPAAGAEVDGNLSAQLQPSIAAFFRAYGAGDTTNLTYYSAPGASFAGLGGQVAFAALDGLQIDQGPADRRIGTATVRWHDKTSGAGFDQTYRLTLMQQNGKWFVAELAPSR